MTYQHASEDPNDVGWVPRLTGYTEDEAYAFLTANASGVFTASANPAAHTGAMVALVPSEADLDRLAVEGGEPLEELHLTLAFLGEADMIDDDMRRKIIEACSGYFSMPVETETFYSTAFNPHNPDMETALVLGVKGEELVGPHGNVMSALRGIFNLPKQHEPWIPHVTLAYDDDVTKASEFCDRLGPITFDTLRFAFGDEVTDFPIGPLTAAAWLERQHPRDDEGRFAGFGTGALSGDAAFNVPKIGVGREGSKSFQAPMHTYSTPASKEINGSLRTSQGALDSVSAGEAPPLPDWLKTASYNPNDKRFFKDDESLRETISSLDEAMSRSVNGEPIIVYRGVGNLAQTIGRDSGEDVVGTEFTDFGFTSTTTNKNFMTDLTNTWGAAQPDAWSNAAEMRILVPAGTSSLAPVPRIREVLLDRGLTYRIVNDHGVDDRGVRQLDVEVVR